MNHSPVGQGREVMSHGLRLPLEAVRVDSNLLTPSGRELFQIPQFLPLQACRWLVISARLLNTLFFSSVFSFSLPLSAKLEGLYLLQLQEQG